MTRGVAVILGKTGRNFAAGMSGGVAYVLDTEGDFRTRCNMGMVDLEPVVDADAEYLHDLIRRHYDYTQSAVAWRLLSGWKESVGRFLKVMPLDYRRVLQEQAAEAAAGGAAN